MTHGHINYPEIRREQLASAVSMRVYGILVEEANTLDEYVAILWCGFAADGEERRECTKRIWHLPKAKIMNSGDVDGFTSEKRQVRWFEVATDAQPIEEMYLAVSLGVELKQALATCGPCSGAEGSHVFASRLGVRTEQGQEVVLTLPEGFQAARRGAIIVRGDGHWLCPVLEASKAGECLKTTTVGLATSSYFPPNKGFDYDTETDTVIIFN